MGTMSCVCRAHREIPRKSLFPSCIDTESRPICLVVFVRWFMLHSPDVSDCYVIVFLQTGCHGQLYHSSKHEALIQCWASIEPTLSEIGIPEVCWSDRVQVAGAISKWKVIIFCDKHTFHQMLIPCYRY